ncbi:hypothetical protein LTR37_021411 [Vermiconidia calcicola]|uniref:Uncharacterized protein n=1 Tax=Vermiconidia calcicola TaxID=1690605 RepID=A0ACC3MAA3_9PEZI|nr:hypothetical protein LTR37_021411 [Vermiconidia calcicola]
MNKALDGYVVLENDTLRKARHSAFGPKKVERTAKAKISYFEVYDDSQISVKEITSQMQSAMVHNGFSANSLKAGISAEAYGIALGASGGTTNEWQEDNTKLSAADWKEYIATYNYRRMSVFQLSRLPERVKLTSSHGRPLVIGLYGLPGSGKTYLLNKLRDRWGDTTFNFHEGSEIIDRVTPGGLPAFQKLDAQMKSQFRTTAITKIEDDLLGNGKVAIVAGHFAL